MQQWPLAQQHTVRSAAMQLLRACCGQFRSDVECEQHQRAWRCQSSNLTASVAGSNIQHVASVVSLPSVRATPPPTTAFCARRSTDTAPYAVTVLYCVDDNGRAHVLSQNERSRRWASQRPGGHYEHAASSVHHKLCATLAALSGTSVAGREAPTAMRCWWSCSIWKGAMSCRRCSTWCCMATRPPGTRPSEFLQTALQLPVLPALPLRLTCRWGPCSRLSALRALRAHPVTYTVSVQAPGSQA